MARWHTGFMILASASLLASCASLAHAADLPQLGKSPTRDVVAAMTREEKVNLVIGTGMQRPGLPPDRQGPAVGEVKAGVPGAAGTTFAIPRLGIPSIVARGRPGRPSDPAQARGRLLAHVLLHGLSHRDPARVVLGRRARRACRPRRRERGQGVRRRRPARAPPSTSTAIPSAAGTSSTTRRIPLVSGRMAAAMVKGVQSEGVGTSVKHFVANDHEWNRNTIDVKVGQRALREIYLRGFEIAVREARPWTVMSSYNKVNGTYTSESARAAEGRPARRLGVRRAGDDRLVRRAGRGRRR